jgi:hypothetical protein
MDVNYGTRFLGQLKIVIFYFLPWHEDSLHFSGKLESEGTIGKGPGQATS